ncbi:ANKYRIN REPEAT PROTEIN [Ceraceosorus bombacis]|uniref:ANKYRIN REPEAT PROTEIN n=1 Tax=Ceraceosorus bombacis TaxID=401625 RepID=A0A0N7LAK7_9BASI|nr:ANKYRIN REPEAT PROTEIN [Ceraceosorus bombacis]
MSRTYDDNLIGDICHNDQPRACAGLPYYERREAVWAASDDAAPPLWLYEPRFAGPFDILTHHDAASCLGWNEMAWQQHHQLPFPSNNFGSGSARLVVDSLDHAPGGYGDLSKMQWLQRRFDEVPICKAVTTMRVDAVQAAISAAQQAISQSDSFGLEAQGGLASLMQGFGEQQSHMAQCTLASPVTGESALHVAAACAQPDVLGALLESGLYVADVQDKSGITPLMYLAWHSSEPHRAGRASLQQIRHCLELLLQHGADPNLVCFGGHGGERSLSRTTALGWAARAWNVAFITIARQHASFDFEPLSKTRATLRFASLRPLPPCVVDGNLRAEEEEHERQDMSRVFTEMEQDDFEDHLRGVHGLDMQEMARENEVAYGIARRLVDQKLEHVGLCFVRAAHVPFGPGGVALHSSSVVQAPHWAWDHSASRLLPDGNTSNRALARRDVVRWMQTVRELVAGGARVSLFRDIAGVCGSMPPPEALAMLLDLYAEQESLSSAAILNRHTTLFNGAIGCSWALILAAYTAKECSSDDFLALVSLLDARGADFASAANCYVTPHVVKAHGPLFDLLRAIDLHQAGIELPLRLRDASSAIKDQFFRTQHRKRVEVLEPIPLLGILIYLGRKEEINHLLDVGVPAEASTAQRWESFAKTANDSTADTIYAHTRST